MDAECKNEEESQVAVTNIQTWKDLIILFGPVLFVLFAGPWSDLHGKWRKPLMYLPLCGQILSDLLCMLNVYFWHWSPVVTALSLSVLPAVTGWRSCFLIGMNSYISDISSEEYRTMRLGICVAVYFLGSPIGAVLFGLFSDTIGLYGVFLASVTFNVVGLIYLCLYVREIKCEGYVSKLKPWEGMINPKHAIQSVRKLLRPRSGYGRAIVILIAFVAPITVAPLQGEYQILYFFLRYRFHFNEADYGYYASYKTIIIFIGTLITLGIFSRILKISDAMIGIMASVTLMVASIGFTFAAKTWQLFVYPLVDFMHGAGLSVVYSIVSKTVENTELGQVNSILGVADAIFPLLNLPLYNQVYSHTFTHVPGAFYLLSFMYGAIALIIFGVVYVLQNLQSAKENHKETASNKGTIAVRNGQT